MNFAERQLQKYGWSKGQGLGKDQTGITEAVSVAFKNDTTGIGKQKTDEFAFEWWDHAFNKAAQNIQVVKDDGEGALRVEKTRELKRRDILSTGSGTVQQGFVSANNSNDGISGDFSSKLNDEDLFRICEGRTAHKGARSAMDGKLQRAKKAGLGLPDYEARSDKKDKKDKKKKRKRDTNDTSDDKQKRRRDKKEKKSSKKSKKDSTLS